MILEDLEPMTDQECQAVSGNFPQFLMGAMLAGISIPVIKNLWNSVSGSIKLPDSFYCKSLYKNKKYLLINIKLHIFFLKRINNTKKWLLL
ncbi:MULTISPECIES: hypothetical protein [unclassified Spiroplasma]|uniref:hypothetical protein n=1 Tax=unclassified Spiroplasma TaxID=2637901 RepID=UPI0030CBCF9F